MDAGRDKESNKIEIMCPCGHDFEVSRKEGKNEFPCPACGRINVLLGHTHVREGESERKGKTTIQTVPPVPKIEKGDLIGPYRITGLIGEGGMGRVYEAVDTHLQRKVALKVLSQQLLDKKDFVARFTREARAIASLNHPNIVQIYYTGEHENLPYYAMEMVDGGSLDGLKDKGGLEPDVAVDLLRQAATGLAAASAEGVIHRDIKPSNLMLDRARRLKIADFGLAKTVAIDSAITHTGTIIGTPYYMPPEQGEGRPLDKRADIYSLGATFYHLLAGSPPFESDSPIGVILKHINEALPSLRKRNKAVPKGLCQVIERMMAKNPDDRYPEYSDLVEDLEAIRSGLIPTGTAVKYNKIIKQEKMYKTQDDEKKSSFIVLDKEGWRDVREIPLKRSGLIRRFFAFLLDYFILFMLYAVYVHGYGVGDFDRMRDPNVLWSILFLILSFLYFCLGDAKGGMTLGKILFRCRVGRKSGESIGFLSSGLRTLFLLSLLIAFGAFRFLGDDDPSDVFLRMYYYAVFPDDHIIAGVCFVWFTISLVFLLMTQGKTALHDAVSGSYVFAIARRHAMQEVQANATRPMIQEEAVASSPRTSVPLATPPQSGVKPPRRKPPPIPREALYHRTPMSPLPSNSTVPPSRKNPTLAMLLSFFPGLGQFYNGDVKKGLFILLTCWLILPWGLGIIDAYFRARAINRRFAAFSGNPPY